MLTPLRRSPLLSTARPQVFRAMVSRAMFFGTLFLSMSVPISATDEICENGSCMPEDAPALSLPQTKAQKMTADEYTDLGPGKCLYQPPTPVLAAVDPKPYAFKYQEGTKCQALCDADAKCGGYTNDDQNNCLLWLTSGLVGGGKNWGNGDCHVKDKTGYKNLGEGKCLFQPVAPKPAAVDPRPYLYKGGEGAKCRELCNADEKCGGYSNDNVNNCLLWLTPGLVGGGHNWGDCKCYVKK